LYPLPPTVDFLRDDLATRGLRITRHEQELLRDLQEAAAQAR
jgi:hypothetical protein